MREETKLCATCEEEKPLKKFYWANKGKRTRRRVCGDCQVATAKENKKKRRYKAEKYKCMSDPWNIYSDGAMMNHGEMMETLKAGYMPPGSVWLGFPAMRRWRVVGNEKWYLLTECLPEDMMPDVAIEKQVLQEIRGDRQPPGGR